VSKVTVVIRRAIADDAEKLGRARHEFSEKGYDLGGVSEFP
jgi:hypothetical protein